MFVLDVHLWVVERSSEVSNVEICPGGGGSGSLWLLDSGQLLLPGVVAPTAAQVGGGGLEAWEMGAASEPTAGEAAGYSNYSFPTPGLQEDRLLGLFLR